MKRLLATLLLLTNLAYGQSWGPMFDAQSTMLNQQSTMLSNLSTDGYVTLPGNLTALLGVGIKQQVRNTSLGNVHEVWAGTPDGNRLLTMRGGQFSTALGVGGQVIAIPHGLGYVPSVYMVNVLNQTSFKYTLTVTGTYLILTLQNQLTLPDTFNGLWIAR